MRKRLITIPVVALAMVLGLWLIMGSSATARAPKRHSGSAGAAGRVVAVSKHASSRPHGSLKARRVRSTKARSVSSTHTLAASPEAESDTESEQTTPNEGDNVDCQQQGDFQGVNAAGTGPGCNGTGV